MGGSAFLGANGSMMIEVIPFLHRIATIIASRHPTDGDTAGTVVVVSTMLFCYALSTVLMSLTFLGLGLMRAGNFVSYFPRPFLIGIIGGVGVFLVETAINVCTGTQWQWSVAYVVELVTDRNMMALLGAVMAVTIILWTAERYLPRFALLMPLFYSIVTVVFYLVACLALGFSLDDLRRGRWLFSTSAGRVDDTINVNTTTTYANSMFSLWRDHISLQHIDFVAVYDCLPTILMLVLFGLLHAPLNVRKHSIQLCYSCLKTTHICSCLRWR
jgi:SulP family sulfate permease